MDLPTTMTWSFYPASYNLPNIISVAATDQDDRECPSAISDLIPFMLRLPAYMYGVRCRRGGVNFRFGILEFMEGTSWLPHVAGLAVVVQLL
jgi:hypothetical protein